MAGNKTLFGPLEKWSETHASLWKSLRFLELFNVLFGFKMMLWLYNSPVWFYLFYSHFILLFIYSLLLRPFKVILTVDMKAPLCAVCFLNINKVNKVQCRHPRDDMSARGGRHLYINAQQEVTYSLIRLCGMIMVLDTHDLWLCLSPNNYMTSWLP